MLAVPIVITCIVIFWCNRSCYVYDNIKDTESLDYDSYENMEELSVGKPTRIIFSIIAILTVWLLYFS